MMVGVIDVGVEGFLCKSLNIFIIYCMFNWIKCFLVFIVIFDVLGYVFDVGMENFN